MRKQTVHVICIPVHTFHNETSAGIVADVISLSDSLKLTIFFELQTPLHFCLPLASIFYFYIYIFYFLGLTKLLMQFRGCVTETKGLILNSRESLINWCAVINLTENICLSYHVNPVIHQTPTKHSSGTSEVLTAHNENILWLVPGVICILYPPVQANIALTTRVIKACVQDYSLPPVSP